MPWSTPSKEDAQITPQEKTSLSTIAGSADQLAKILDREIASARGIILAGGGQLDQDGTLPDQIIPDVLAIVTWRYLLFYPSLKTMQTDNRKTLYDEARKNLAMIAKGELNVELPAVGQAMSISTPSGQIQQVTGDKRRLTRHKLHGL